MEPVIQLTAVTKRFPGVVANDGISLSVAPGEIHALVGENGAGKSTLMKILSGLYQPDEGEIRVRGRAVRIQGPAHAIALGIGMVHQHFMLVPRLTVTENVVLGAEPVRAGVLDLRTARARVRELAGRYGFQLDPDAVVEDLSVGEQQRVEILKVLYRGADVIILDEPTAVLVPQEVAELFENLRALRSQGKAIIFISHKLDEVLTVADRITVLRRGRVAGTVARGEASKADLARLMVGRPVLFRVEKPAATPGEAVLEVEGLTVQGHGGRAAVNGVSFVVRAGEIYGLAGVEGNGQRELVEALVGLRGASGSIRLQGRELLGRTVAGIRELGVGFIPEDRQRQGLILGMSVAANLILGRHRREPFARGFRIDWQAVYAAARAEIEAFGIRTPSERTAARTLSGGNQQRVVLARELAGNPRLIIAVHPTRGLDVGAIELVHRRLIEERTRGRAVLLVSADLDEMLSVSDRIGVMYNGRLVAEFRPDAVTPETVGRAMVGDWEGAA